MNNNTTIVIPNGNVKIYNYEEVEFDTGIPWKDVAFISIVVSFGDEIATIFTKDNKSHVFDSARELGGEYNRTDDEITEVYGIVPNQFKEWADCPAKERDNYRSWK